MLNNFVSIPQPETQQSKPIAAQNDDGGKHHAQKSCFAAFNALNPRFEADSISESAFWCWALWSRKRDPFGSRKQFDALDWTILTARLNAAQNAPACFKALCAEIRHAGDCEIINVENDKEIYRGLVDKKTLDRAKKYAENNNCTIKLTAYETDQIFQPEVDPITSCRFDETEDGHPLMFVKFAGNEKEYTYDKLNLRQNTTCMLMWFRGEKQELKDYLDQIRFHYESYMAGDMSKEEFEKTRP